MAGRTFALFCMAVWSGVLILTTGSLSAAPPAIIADGEAKAQIVLPEERPRMVTLAALELQHYLEKVTGARLPIVTEPTDAYPVQIHVGASDHTHALGVTNEGLKYGAYRMVSGDDWLVLLGSDFDYQPPEPYARGNNDIPNGQAAWDELTKDKTDTAWGYPFASYYKKHWRRGDRTPAMAERYGEENAKLWTGGDFSYGFWSDDEGGSLNAVYAWLRTLGLRWYMPGEIGEVIPEQTTIVLEPVDRTIRADFDLRAWFWYNYGVFPLEDVLWARQIGLNGGSEVLGGGQNGFAHGHVRVHKRQEMQEKHPEYYALRGDKRDTEHRGQGTACYSSKGLERETIAYARFMFDHYDWPKFSVWPGDGFRQCQCEDCTGKTPSELVWGFVDRVARELYQSHPDRIVFCGAYTPYREPPASIERFSPNVVVDMANRGRPTFIIPERWEFYLGTLEAWRTRLAPRRIVRGDNNRYHMGEKVDFPIIQARAQAKDLQMLKGISIGEISEQSQRKGLLNPGANHLGLYTQARYLWDAEQDIDALLDDYFTRFYGPASEQMAAAFAFADDAYARAVSNASGRRAARAVPPINERIQYIQMLQDARQTAGADTIYGQRIELLLGELHTIAELRKMQREAARAGDIREDAPLAVAHGPDKEPTTYTLTDIKTGATPALKTTFQVVWDDGALVFDFYCQEPEMDSLFIGSQVWDGDSVALLLETPTHAYYQIEIDPNGEVYDADRGTQVGARWKSQVLTEATRGKDHWRVTVRVPVVSAEAGEADPNHNVSGPKPTADAPWYFNVGRVRPRDNQRQAYMFSPTGSGYHVPEKFGRLVVR